MKKYSHGFVLGKFMPLHNGHIALIHFGLEHCRCLTVLVCFDKKQESKFSMSGNDRFEWVKSTFAHEPRIDVVFTDADLPDSSESDREVSFVWSQYLKQRFPSIDVIFTSEKYGDYVAEFMGIKHILFDQQRKVVPVSATMIRENPIKNWQNIASAAKHHFVKKICLYGPESCGKSTLAIMLAKFFQTNYVPEMAREIFKDPTTGIERHCIFDDIYPNAIKMFSRSL